MDIKKIKKNISIVLLIFFIVLPIFFFLLPINGNKKQIRSSDLIQKKMKDGKVLRIDYYDKNGKMAFAADKHYATIIQTDNDNSILENYYDEQGNPVKQPSNYYAILKEYDDVGRNIRLTFLDNNGDPTMNTNGYSIVKKTFNRDNRVEWEMYYDTENKPVSSMNYGFGCYEEYDEYGRIKVVVYVDMNRKPTITQLGYAIRHNYYYEEGLWSGKVKNVFYYDEYERPIARTKGEFGLYLEYDDFGRENKLTYLDASGNPIKTKNGYTTIIRTYYPDDTIKTEMYFDQNGQPVALSQGQYGILNENGEVIFLDADGHKRFNILHFINTNHFSVILIALGIVTISSILLSKKENIVFFVLYSAFILYITLMHREKSETRAELELFWSYKKIFSDQSLRMEILKNIWLFVPIGSILRRIWSVGWSIFVAVVLSFIIEIIQYITGFGLAEFDDIISNGIGALIGFGYGYELNHMISFIKERKAYKFN